MENFDLIDNFDKLYEYLTHLDKVPVFISINNHIYYFQGFSEAAQFAFALRLAKDVYYLG